MNDVMSRSTEDFGDLKKSEKLRFRPGRGQMTLCTTGAMRWVGELRVEIWVLRKVVDFWSRLWRDQLGSTKCAACGGVQWKSQHSKKLCLSLLMSKNLKLKKVIKSFIPEPVLCFSDSYMFMNIMNILWTFVYFTYSYPGRIFGPIYM